VACLLLAGPLVGCGSHDPGTHDSGADASGASARAGDLTVSGARIPAPASPDVGVAYLRLANQGTTADRMVAASSPAARSVTAMKDVERDGASTMVAVPALTVPAGGSTTLEPGGLHLMLEHLARQLTAGDRVELRLRFAHAGMVRIMVPVVPLTGTSDQPSDMGSMPGM